jgi:hypothetical protein
LAISTGALKRRREVVLDDQRQHLCLQRAFESAAFAEQRGRSAPFADQLQQHLHPSAPGIDRSLDGSDVEHLPPSCRRPLEGASERPFADDAGKVHQRPRRARAGDAINSPGLLESGRPHEVQPDAVDLATVVAGCNDVYHRWPLVKEA